MNGEKGVWKEVIVSENVDGGGWARNAAYYYALGFLCTASSAHLMRCGHRGSHRIKNRQMLTPDKQICIRFTNSGALSRQDVPPRRPQPSSRRPARKRPKLAAFQSSGSSVLAKFRGDLQRFAILACAGFAPRPLLPLSRPCRALGSTQPHTRPPSLSQSRLASPRSQITMAEEEGAASYSLWLCPAPESAVARRIQTEIDFWLAPGQGVPFAPHVTLLGGLSCREADAVANAKALSAQLRVRTVSVGIAAPSDRCTIHCQ